MPIVTEQKTLCAIGGNQIVTELIYQKPSSQQANAASGNDQISITPVKWQVQNRIQQMHATIKWIVLLIFLLVLYDHNKKQKWENVKPNVINMSMLQSYIQKKPKFQTSRTLEEIQ